MSDFSDVDRSAGPDRLVRYLDDTDAGLAAIKSYIVAAAARAVAPAGLVLDLGCGVGHDLVRLDGVGLSSVGLDVSAVMLAHARGRVLTAPLVQGDGHHLPFRSGALAGCRIERVLQHVSDPRRVIAEVARILRAGGWLGVFEPDHTSFRIESAHGDSFLADLMRVRHPRIGADLPALLGDHGFVVEDLVTERSNGSSVDGLPVDATTILRRAVLDGRAEPREVERWLDEQRARTEAGTFHSTWVKVLAVARRT